MLSDDERSLLLQSALSQLHQIGLEAYLRMTAGKEAALIIRRPEGDIAYEPHVVTRASPAAADRGPQDSPAPIMVAPFITSAVADAWRRRGLAFIDTAGNAYLNEPGLLVDIRGRPRPKDVISNPKTLRAFKNNGLRIIFVLLCDPANAASPYRDIARLSGTSLGTVHGVFAELEEAGYLTVKKDLRQLRRSHELFKRWVDAYALDLYPRLKIGAFDAPNSGWWKGSTDALQADGGQWGGEVAAHLLGSRLLPAQATIYASGVPSKVAIQHRFRRVVDGGNVEIRQRFWFFEPPHSPIVPAPLIYADLYASGDPREIEAAEYLKENDEALRRFAKS